MNNSKLYVGNLPFSSTEADVEALFSSYGEVVDVKIITERDTGRSRGFGFVTFGSQKDAEEALTLNGHDMNGRRLVVNVAREKSEGPGRRP